MLTMVSFQVQSYAVEDDFEQLMLSKNTIKVSLTPSRLLTYDVGAPSPSLMKFPLMTATGE